MELFRIVRRPTGSDGEYVWNGGQLMVVEESAVEARDRIQRVNDMYAAEAEGFPSHEYQVERATNVEWEVLFDSDFDYPEEAGKEYPWL